MAWQAIPAIDVTALRSGDEAARRAVAREIDGACREVGFFHVVGHGVDPALVPCALETARRFFALPLEVKLGLSGGRSYRGYHPLASDIPSALVDGAVATAYDHREHFHVGIDNEARPDDPFSGRNLWPDEPADFRPVMEACFEALTALSLDLVRGFALALTGNERGFGAMFRRPYALLNPIRYPPREPDGSGSGIAGHVDYGFLTVLAQDGAGGLEVQDDAGGWHPVQPRPDAFVCNLGSMIQLVSGGAWRATRHRVVSPAGRDRYSMPFFLDPDPDAVLRPVAEPDAEGVVCLDYLLGTFGRKADNAARVARGKG